MDDFPAHALLREALEMLNDHPNFSLRTDRRATSYRLAGRIEAYFASCNADDALVSSALALLGSGATLRFEAPPADEARRWVPAWVALPSALAATRVAAVFDRAVAALPPVTREVFLAHRDRELDYTAIAAELGIAVAEVERHVATALIRLDEALSAETAALGL